MDMIQNQKPTPADKGSEKSAPLPFRLKTTRTCSTACSSISFYSEARPTSTQHYHAIIKKGVMLSFLLPGHPIT